MEKRRNDIAGIENSLLGFGAMRLPLLDPNDNTSIDQAQVNDMVDYAIAHGVNYFDTAYVYHGQTSEAAMAKALAKYPRESYYLATKLPVFMCEKPEDMRRLLDESLARCGTDYIDFYLYHAIAKPRFEIIKQLGLYEEGLKLKAEGKIRNLGLSFHDTPDVLEEILSTYKFDFVQLQINYLDWKLINAERFYEIAKKHDLPIFVMEPIRGGFLSKVDPAYAEPFAQLDGSSSQSALALRWVAQHPQVKVILSGMSNMQQLQENVATFSPYLPLNEKEQEVISAVTDKILGSLAVPCTGCNYCMPCPFGVNIPAIFPFYNRYKLTGRLTEFTVDYVRGPVAAGQDASLCQQCGACAAQCPQQIDIPAQMVEINATYRKLNKLD